MPFSVALLRKVDSLPPDLKEVLCLLLEEIEQQREAAVTKTDFNQLRDIVAQLAKAQKRTEQQIKERVKAQQETTREIASLNRGGAEL